MAEGPVNSVSGRPNLCINHWSRSIIKIEWTRKFMTNINCRFQYNSSFILKFSKIPLSLLLNLFKIIFWVFSKQILFFCTNLTCIEISCIKSMFHFWFAFQWQFQLCSQMFISLAVAVGGHREFPNDAISTVSSKPWRNSGTKVRKLYFNSICYIKNNCLSIHIFFKALLQFYEATNDWSTTWRGEDTDLVVDYVKVYTV